MAVPRSVGLTLAAMVSAAWPQATRAEVRTAAVGLAFEIAQDFGDTEDAHGQRDEVQPVSKGGDAEIKRGTPV